MFQSILMAGLLIFGAAETTGAPSAECRFDKVYAYQTNVHTAYFDLFEMANITLIGDGHTDLDVYVYDPFGNLVAYDNGVTDIAYLSWWATARGTYKIEVINYGSGSNEYLICADGDQAER